jgi:hypothetical protein
MDSKRGSDGEPKEVSRNRRQVAIRARSQECGRQTGALAFSVGSPIPNSHRVLILPSSRAELAKFRTLLRRNGDENHSLSISDPLLRWRQYMSVAVDSTATNRSHSELNNAKVSLDGEVDFRRKLASHSLRHSSLSRLAKGVALPSNTQHQRGEAENREHE